MYFMSLKIKQVKYIISILQLVNPNGKNQLKKMHRYYQKKLIIIKIKNKLQIIIPQLRY